MKQDYKFKTLKDLIDDKAANAVVGAAQKVYDRLRRAGRFTTPLETRMEAAKFVRDTINQYWDYVRDLDPDDEADKAKLDFYQKAVKEKVGYVPKREVIER